MAKISFYTDSPHGRTIIVCYRSDFTNFCFSVCILSNTKKNSLFHTVGYKNHSAGYIFHSVGYKSRTVKQRICKNVLKNVTGYAELINRAERIIFYCDLHGKGYCKLITTRGCLKMYCTPKVRHKTFGGAVHFETASLYFQYLISLISVSPASYTQEVRFATNKTLPYFHSPLFLRIHQAHFHPSARCPSVQ